MFVFCGCSTSITTTGSGTEVYEQVKQVLEAHRAREIVDGDLGMKGSSWKQEPARGKFVFEHKPRGKFTAARLIEISIRPWDERPEVKRTVRVYAWHWNWFPPWWAGPDFGLQKDVAGWLLEAFQQNDCE